MTANAHIEPPRDANCFICSAARDYRHGCWYDRPLMRDEGARAVVLPALGALARGHVLVSPTAHVRAAHHVEGAARDTFLEVLLLAVAWTRKRYGHVTVFEHSSPQASQGPRAACTEHAHVQVTPGSYRLASAEADYDKYPSLGSFFEDSSPPDGYVMFTQPDGSVWVTQDVGLSQYFRRLICAANGERDEWDYLVFPRFERVDETIRDYASATG